MIRRVAAALAASAFVVSCGGADATGNRGDLHVFAAASLTEAFETLGEAFERDHPGTNVSFTFGGSGALARQIADGATADVFASADRVAIADVTDQLGEPVVIARNRLTIVVERGNPKRIDSFGDLDDDVVVVLCAPQVPCGRYAAEALRRAGVNVAPASLEENVKAVVAKVGLGEADAGIAYATDALAAATRVDAVPIETDRSLDAEYPMAVLDDAANADVALAWLRFVRSPDGRKILQTHGFRAP